MSTRLAECPLYQWFCGLDRLGEIQVPSKSEIHRGEQLATPGVLKEINAQMISAAAQVPEAGEDQVLGLKNEIELKTVWMDSTAVKTNIHYPVDYDIAARCHANADESNAADSSARIETPDGVSRKIFRTDERLLYGDERDPTQGRQQAKMQTDLP